MSRSHAAAESNVREAKSVPFSKIFIDPKINSRRKLHHIPELAKNIDQNGLESALLVTNGGPKDRPYTLAAGYRRCAALNKLGWGDKPVNVIVVPNLQGSNLIENVLREPLPAYDLAERLAEMKEGTYYDPSVPEDQEKKKYSTGELAKMLSKSPSQIGNLIRAHQSLTDEVKELTREWDPPARLLFVWAGKSESKQLDMAKEWVAYQKRLEAGGRKRQAKGAGDKATSNKSNKPGKKDLEERVDQLLWKADQAKKGSREAEVAAAVAEVLRFVLGEGRFPSDVFSGEDGKAYKAALKAQEKVEKAEAEQAAAAEE